jgi:glucose/mannose transport system substrate-binding protein
MKAGLEILKDPDHVIQGAGIYLNQDSIGQMDDLWAEAWANPDLSVEEIQQRFVDIIASAE